MANINPLHYAPSPPLLCRAPVRPAVTLAILLAILIAGALWGRPAWNKLQLLYWQARCMRYATPQGNLSTPVDWLRFHQLANGSGLTSQGTVFLHGRASRRGRRLVAVDVYSGCWNRRLVARTFVPGTLISRPKETGVSVNDDIGVPFRAVIHPGQPNSSDTSHFVIQYSLDGATHVIDGWLADDDTVLLEPRRPIASITASP